jgi:Leucine-rich repeat (LRR) protein
MRMLELSSNKIEKIENLIDFPKLEQLYINKNRIQKIENLEPVKHITLLGLSVY